MNKALAKRKATKERRKLQSCRVFELKIDKSHLSKKRINHLHSIFKEAKWFYNYCLTFENINDADTTSKFVQVKVKENYENRNFTALKSQMKQSIKTRIFNSLSSLKELKKNGSKVGRLKFKSFVNSVPLKQFKNSFDLDIENNRIRVQGIKSWLRVRGLEQIKDDVEIANAVLIRKSNDFYLHVITFENKQPVNIPEQAIGIDFGCETQLTLSDGTKIEFQVPISKRLKKLDRRIDKKVNGKIGRNRSSNNRRKLQLKRRKEYEKITNKKSDIRNKIVSAITKNYKYVCFQDERIHAWHSGNHGKKIQHSGIGAVLSDLKNKSDTPIMVNKFFPSTQLCPQCGTKNKMPVEKRIYKCQCGFSEDRDIKSARCILEEGLRNKRVPTDYRDFKLEENASSTYFDFISGIKVSKKSSMSQEAPSFMRG